MSPPVTILHQDGSVVTIDEPILRVWKSLSHVQLFATPLDYIVHGILQTRILEWVAVPFSSGSSSPGIKPRSPALQADSLSAEPQGMPKNTEVGSLSLLQWIFLTKDRTGVSCISDGFFTICVIYINPFSSVQSLSHVRLFATPWVAARQASLSITISRSSLRLTSIESVMPSSHLILCHPLLLLPPIPPSIRIFSNESTHSFN